MDNSEQSRAKSILFLRAVAGLAWADGRIDKAERAYLRKLQERMSLDESDRKRLDAMLEKAMPADDAERLLRDMMRAVFDSRERQQILQILRELAAADGEVSPEEHDFIRRLETGLQSRAIGKILSSAHADDGKEQNS